jgi:hypothetical protein
MKRLLYTVFCLLASDAALAYFPPVQLNAIADAWTDTRADRSNTNFGSSGILALSAGRVVLVKFDAHQLSQHPGSINRLRLNVQELKQPTNVIEVHLVLAPWNEATVTSRTLPAIAPVALDTKTVTRSDSASVVELDVAPAVARWRSDLNTNFGLAIVVAQAPTNIQFFSRESSNGPTLALSSPLDDGDVTVAPSGGDYSDPVTAARNALTGDVWCNFPNVPNPCTMHIAAGRYVLRETLTVPEHTRIAGASKSETVLIAANGFSTAIVTPGGTISDLSVVSRSQGFAYAGNEPLNLERVSIRGGYNAITLSLTAGPSTFVDSDFIATSYEGGLAAMEIIVSKVPLTLTGCRVSANSNTFATGLSIGGTSLLELIDTEVNTSGGTEGVIGVRQAGAGSLMMRGGAIRVSGRAPTVIGALATQSSGLQLLDTQVTVTGSTDGVAVLAGESSSLILDGVKIDSIGQGVRIDSSSSDREASILRSQIVARDSAMIANQHLILESSYLQAPTALMMRAGRLDASTSTFNGLVQLNGTSAHCEDVLGAKLAPLPASCMPP